MKMLLYKVEEGRRSWERMIGARQHIDRWWIWESCELGVHRKRMGIRSNDEPRRGMCWWQSRDHWWKNHGIIGNHQHEEGGLLKSFWVACWCYGLGHRRNMNERRREEEEVAMNIALLCRELLFIETSITYVPLL